MTNRASITALNITPASYANRRGNQRLAALSEIIGWLATADAADLAAMTNLDDLRAIADMALGRNGNKGSESKELRQRAEQLDGLIARAAGFAEQAEADAPPTRALDDAKDGDTPESDHGVKSYMLPEDEAAAAEQIEDTLPEDEGSNVDHTTAWTTNAPEAYDGFGTWTEQKLDDGMRLVRIHDDHLEWQQKRYWSGGFACGKPVVNGAVLPADAPAPILATGDAAESETKVDQDAAIRESVPAEGGASLAEQVAETEASMPALDVLTLHAIAAHRRMQFLDCIAMPEARILDILAALDRLTDAGFIVQQGSGTALHKVMLAPAYADRLDARLVELPKLVARVVARRTPRRQQIKRSSLVDGQQFDATYKGQRWSAKIEGGMVTLPDGRAFRSLSAAGSAITGRPTSGTSFWREAVIA